MSNQINTIEAKTNINRTFDGPIELLLSLIEKRKLQINTLSLSKITNDYLEKIKKQAVFPSQEVAKVFFVLLSAICPKNPLIFKL